MNTFRHIKVERHGEVFCVRLSKVRLEEPEVYQLAEELITLVTRDGCRRMAISLGPEPPSCLYSVFLAKLVTIQRILDEHGGELVLIDTGPTAKSVFEACFLERQFTFLPNWQAALKYWSF